MNLLSSKQKEDVFSTLEIYPEFPFHESLRNHPLRESDPRIRSITVDDDLRIIFRDRGEGNILLLDVGDHVRVY